MKKKGLILLLYLILTFFLIFEASAVMLPMSTEELSKESDVVVRGNVITTEGKWSKNKELIVTHVVIEISEIYKGLESYQNIIVEVDGGEVDGIGYGVSDMAKFKVGEEVIVFLKSAKSKVDFSDVYTVVGSAQGKYEIKDGIVSKEGFSVFIEKEEDKSMIDNNIKLDSLVDKVVPKEGHAFISVDRSKKAKGVNNNDKDI